MRTTLSSKPNRSPNRRLNRRTLLLVIAVLLIASGLIVLDRRGTLEPIKGAAQIVLLPVEQRLTQFRLAAGDWLNNVIHAGSLSRRNAELEAQLSAAQARIVQLEAKQAENDNLKRQLGIEQVYGWRTIAASVVQTNADNGRRMLRIARGRVDGLAVGMAVVAKEGGSPAALIGVIDQVYAQSADVLLITDGGSTISARTTTQTPASGMVIGQWQVGSRIKLTVVDRDAKLEDGDFVVTAGLSKGVAVDTPMAQIPPGVPIGFVLSTEATNREQSAELQPFVDPDRVRSTWVILAEQTAPVP